jgi:hypothetical protein
MLRGKFIGRCKDMIIASSSNSDADNHDSLGAYQEQAWASTNNASSSSTMPQHRGGPFTARFIYPQIQDLVEGQPFNVSLFFFYNDMFNNF